jgi:hypothetical protein
VSGSYAPGDILFFKGSAQGTFAPAEKLRGKDGGPAHAGLASSVAITDWDRDGKLDLIVGNIWGEVALLRNESNGGKLVFGAPQRLIAGGEKVKVDGDAGPIVVDWDGDGIPDLLVGASDGSVTFFKASGTTGAPTLGAGVKLIEPLSEKQREELRVPLDAKSGEMAVPGFDRSQMRTKVAVYDWNGDGKLDLVVGDVVNLRGPDPELSPEQEQEKGKLEQAESELSREVQKIRQSAHDRARTELGIKDEWSSTDAQQRVFNRENEILRADAHYMELSKRSSENWLKMKPFQPKFGVHGFVWVYLRK